MHVVYTLQDAPESLTQSIFLAGPTPRDPETPSWRPEALKTLERLGYDGVVFIPEYEGDWAEDYEYGEQVEWEEKYLHMADRIVFWVPRDIEGGLPAFTTNIEWGKWQASGKCVLGAPPEADKVRYLVADATRQNIVFRETLEETLGAAVGGMQGGSLRSGGEREVPLHIWKTEAFQRWYGALVKAGNRLDGAKLLWHFGVGPDRSIVFCFALHVNVWIESEGRAKTNEFVLSRTDISTIVAYRRPMDTMRHDTYLQDTEVALIREFRSPASTRDGFIREVPGGSSFKVGQDPAKVMAEELDEETGLTVEDHSRFKAIGSRQTVGTFSAHKAHAYSIRLTDWEMGYLKQQQAENAVHGNEGDSERTYVEVHRVNDLLDDPSVDWSMMGMILTALLTEPLE